MTVSIVQHVIGTGASASPLLLTITAPTSGNIGCGFIFGNETNSGWSVSDGNNSYTVNTTTFGDDTADAQGVYGFYEVLASGGTTTLTITHASDNIGAAYIELHSTTGWTGFQNAASGANATTSTTLACSTSLGASGATIVAGWYINNSETFQTAAGGMTSLDSVVGNASSGGIVQTADVLSASGAITPSFTFLTAANGAIVALAFTPASAGGCPHRSMMMGAGCAIWAAKKIEENKVITRRRLILPPRMAA